MSDVWKARLAGASAGAVNGLFGGGGGMIFLPLLSGQLKDRRLFATCVAVILPICCVSAAVYFLRGGLSFLTALPYLAGGAVGGFVGGRFYGKIPTIWLRRAFGLFLLYGGVRYLL
ncbi:TSUP family transporter [Oscillibacter sp. MSJ-2]|uniref:Probable membrane transporter protein n=1 Tax=Dysosmobacter acutus TaxID=2841504 RepID=A0ABS6F8V4_9FIRM|nr:TSUP family transporter [Dysosmobacter acutus]MBU5626002.1 TSUP family transporter [Dysosmobacter acutus]